MNTTIHVLYTVTVSHQLVNRANFYIMVNVLQELACLPYQKNTTRANLEKSHDEKQEPEESNMEGQEPEERNMEDQEPVDSVEVHGCNFCFLISLLIEVISNN